MTTERKTIAKVKTIPKGSKFIVEPPPKVNLLPDTTLEEDTNTAGQRRISLMWETTQALIALSVTGALIYVSVHGIDSEELKNAFFLIIGFYFSRTNHTTVGGVGKKVPQSNVGTR